MAISRTATSAVVRYEPPAIVALGELARGSGLCAPGSSPSGGPDCTNGQSAPTGSFCSVGELATNSCQQGDDVTGQTCFEGSGAGA